jgi:hypothetical protein
MIGPEKVNFGNFWVFFPKKDIIVKKLNTRSHAKFPAANLKNPFYTPDSVCGFGLFSFFVFSWQ